LHHLVHGLRGRKAGGLVLSEVLHHDLVALVPGAPVWGLDAGDETHERRLAGAIRRDEGDPVTPLDVQVHAVEDNVAAVGLVDVGELEDGAAALRADRKGEADALALGGHFDRDDLVERLDSALDLRGLGGLVPKPVDERPEPSDLVVLLLLGPTQPLEVRIAVDQVSRIVANVVGDRPERDLGNARHHGVEEEPIV
jgi:hypothetical protein